MSIADNLRRIHDRIDAAAARSGRSPDDVRLVAVTKYVGAAEVAELIAAGCRDLGESRPQELWRKAEAMGNHAASAVRWHMIGHLQRNKVRRTLPFVAWIHSADNPTLLAELAREAAHLDRPINVLLEINVSGDDTKHGLTPEAARELTPRLDDFQPLAILGLMTMAAREGDLNVARANFAALRHLLDELREAAPGGLRFDELSMGMSGDFEVAIEEGATIVRVGSALFA